MTEFLLLPLPLKPLGLLFTESGSESDQGSTTDATVATVGACGNRFSESPDGEGTSDGGRGDGDGGRGDDDGVSGTVGIFTDCCKITGGGIIDGNSIVGCELC